MPRTSDRLDIALIMHSARNDNLGVGALTVSEIEILRTAAERHDLKIHITILDGRGQRPVYVSGPDITVRDVRVFREPLGFFAAVRDSDLVIDIGAGDSFADIYGKKRLTGIFLMKTLTLLARRPLVLAPQTVGPFNRRVSRFLAAWTIRWSALVATRDEKSTRCVRELGVTRDVIEASDVALRLPHTPPGPRPAGAPIRVGINVSGLLMSGGYTRDNMFGLALDYRGLVHAIIERFLAHPDACEVHLVPHVLSWRQPAPGSGHVEDDRSASLELAETFPQVTVAPAFQTPSEAKSYIAGLDFFMGARMHACIAAFSTGVPVIPMAYSRKFEGLFGTLGYDRTVDCTTDSAESILDRIFAGYEDRATLAAEAREAMARGIEKLSAYEDALADLLVRLDARRR